MLVEQNKVFSHGFVLAEEVLRRIVDTMKEQIQKVNSEVDYIEYYEVKFKNGVLAKIDSLEEVLKSENGGSRKILNLKICIELPDDKEKITISYSDLDDKDVSSYHPVKLSILGEERDWVFVTSSLLEERIAATKKFSFRHLFSVERIGIACLLAVILTMMFLFYFQSSKSDPVEQPNRTTELKKLEQLYDKGELTDPVKVLFQIERIRIGQSSVENVDKEKSRWKLMFPLLLSIVLLPLFTDFFDGKFPRYVFLWGENEKGYKKYENGKKFVLVVILIGTVVSFAGGVLANKFKF